ncbi:MAG: hypothetical protein ACR2L1_09775 [Pyrinomonadaceae bacterium]
MNKFTIYFVVLFLCFLTVIETKSQTRKSVSGAEVTGTFRDVSGSEFKILALGRGKLRVGFSGVYNFKTKNGEPMANVGEARGKADISGDTAIFKPEETEQCTMILRFLPNRRLKVTQKGVDAECGFGVNVSADGNYKKISRAKPKFTEP